VNLLLLTMMMMRSMMTWWNVMEELSVEPSWWHCLDWLKVTVTLKTSTADASVRTDPLYQPTVPTVTCTQSDTKNNNILLT